MNRQIVGEEELLGSIINVECTIMDRGVHVLIVSNPHGHVGAVSHMEEEGGLQTVQYPGHKDAAISDVWAKRLYEQLQRPVTVCCGIHYENITKKQLEQVVARANEILEELLEKI